MFLSFSYRHALTAWLLLLAASTVQVQAQDDYLAQPVTAWTATTSAVGPGNGAFSAPDGSAVVVLSRDCTVTSLDPTTGAVQWTVAASGAGQECTSGIFFSYGAATEKYMIYAVSNGAGQT